MSLAPRRIWRAPAAQALLIQAAALPLSFLAVLALSRMQVAVSLGTAALIQGALALVLSYLRRLAPWWLAIQPLFPPALVGAAGLQLPPSLFLAGFLILLLVYWSTFRTQVPYFPSGRRAWDAVAALLPPDRPVCLIDIGSGLGGLVLELARRRPDSTFAGIELAPLPWLVSMLRARFAGGHARFVRGDYEQLDFGDYDVVFAYLSPAAMDALWRKASAEMRPGTLLLSYEFAIAAKPPDLSIMPKGPGPVLYGWHF
ncbi:MAG TPA: class I SAM-dependent methyltransferase [Telluria sp.]|nr:class I SAM-dependent methyltransferase [Telluria sp.]